MAANANRDRMPSPPPNHGFQAPPGMVQGGPPMNRLQQSQQPQQQYASQYLQNFQQGGSAPAYRADTIINAYTRIYDIRPEKTEAESFCKKQLTSYEVFTVLPSNDDDSKDKDDSKSKKRERWAKVTINQESYPTDQIIKTIQKLDAGKLSIAEKKARLFPNQSTQVTNILNSKIMTEREGQIFE
ncbi:hypothetical protein V502_08618 [Pseudogymnoascus sp. VKM F-4520 (FW-2644)]|nr:hypothetical protein V502_08618 [Pseudogymnoascus sp. VKM F-4520 (FW-2644)]